MRKRTMIKAFQQKPSFLLLAAFCIVVQSSTAQKTSQFASEIQALEDFVVKQMEYDRIPGLSIGFVKDDFFWAKGFGHADLENLTPASEKSAYRLASNTKSMTAVAILKLVENRKVDLDAEVQAFVPYFPRKPWPVTVRQLLGHLGGISHYRDYDVEGHIKEPKDTRDALDIFAGFELVAEPGTRYQYTSYGYNLLGAVIEGAAKKSYEDYLHEILWDPLQMNDTHMDDPDELLPGRIRGYRIIDGEIRNSEYVDISSRFAAGGTRSTVVDLLKYAVGLNSGKVLSPESLDQMYSSMARKDGHLTDYGMGLRISPVNGHFSASHTGGQPETRTLLVQFPQENFFLALAYNLEGANLFVYGHRLAQLILDESWNRRAYTPNREDDAIYGALWDVFNYGLSYFDRYQEPLTSDGAELEEAFRYFTTHVNRDSLFSNYDAAKARIDDGRHPVAGKPFVKIGSYMASLLKEESGSSGLDAYHKKGAIPFFYDYLKATRSQNGDPQPLAFSRTFEDLLSNWNKDWTKAHTDDIRRLTIGPSSDLDRVKRQLRKSFSGASVYPDFSEELARTTEYFLIRSDEEKAYEAAEMAVSLYPASPVAHVMLAITHVLFGDEDKAKREYKKALEINPDSPDTRPRAFNSFARTLIDNGKLDEALALLTLATELHPDDAGLYTSIADIHLKRSRIYYEKALRVDPASEMARKMLKKIR